ncbi:hypothetical protein [Bradyrhizobium canariense]|uniref:hypothetical protein n=1 Tax=Bradyrhizobium canariense TaxID=255045 RepID=UPI000A19682C|nr:hypothetical protein [Bradyrhizobium canariense]OSI20472.1 hypothetical protein BST65_32325 [Bradyrhizobium canariense]OSI33391.1 hypothetical protein BST66_13295 [Bradyrhizobium canariense]OSI39610.1 hypothetical protein BSZ20_29160 [Bradyrhizobium canariense]OSI47634.1 hypothetical protein BST67_19640 [Bradyrhizobium canariense]OSI55977.1 hypothetical protein BSZ15_18140 [Bradyrhizobium canariense]
MDMKEASAMMEASGLANEQDGVDRASAARLRAEAEASRRPLRPASQDAAMRWVDQLRELTLKVPLQSLCVAFLLGVWVARRR